MKIAHNAHLYFVKLPLIIVIVSLIGMGIYARRGWNDWRRMVLQNQELAVRIAAAHVQREAIERQIETFSTDRSEQERVIRQTLGYVRHNETIIEFE